jgi:hypothetical protein
MADPGLLHDLIDCVPGRPGRDTGSELGGSQTPNICAPDLGVLGPLWRLDQVGEGRELISRHGAEPDPAVLRRFDRRYFHHSGRARRYRCQLAGHGPETVEDGDRHLEPADVYELAVATSLSLPERNHDGHGRDQAGGPLGEITARRHRPPRFLAPAGDRAAQGLQCQICGGPARPRTGRTKR